jgi:hypothetical protein
MTARVWALQGPQSARFSRSAGVVLTARRLFATPTNGADMVSRAPLIGCVRSEWTRVSTSLPTGVGSLASSLGHPAGIDNDRSDVRAGASCLDACTAHGNQRSTERATTPALTQPPSGGGPWLARLQGRSPGWWEPTEALPRSPTPQPNAKPADLLSPVAGDSRAAGAKASASTPAWRQPEGAKGETKPLRLADRR